MTSHDSIEEAVANLWRQQLDGDVDSDTDRRGAERLLRQVSEPREVAPKRRIWLLAAAIVTCCVLAIAVVRLLPKPALGYTLDSSSRMEGDYLRTDAADAKLRFEDGTQVVVQAQSSCRLQRVDARGAVVQLERGRVSVDVVPREGSRWQVAAGPYVVTVTGTAFSVAWEPASQQLDLAVTRGSVRLSGAAAGEGLAVEAGQQVRANAARAELQVSRTENTKAAGPHSTAPSASSTAASVDPAPSAHDAEVPGSAQPPPTSAQPALRPSWSQRVSAGEYRVVMAEADARGLDGVLASASLADVVAVSDAARYSGRGQAARSALLALRSRFANSEPARTAAFLLGRMAEGGSAAGALRWYNTYLAEAPGGSFAAEALGRRMMLQQRSGSAAAKASAKQYLAAYPRGPYAEAARKIAR